MSIFIEGYKIKFMFNKFLKTKILVIGDLMIDKFIFGNAEKLTFEAPIPLVEIDDLNSKLGGAGLIIENCKNLGADVTYVGPLIMMKMEHG